MIFSANKDVQDSAHTHTPTSSDSFIEAFFENFDYSSEIKSIEDKEQCVIQRIRTCGIPKSKENSIVDDVLDLRKHRKRLLKQITVDMGTYTRRMMNTYTVSCDSLQNEVKRLNADIEEHNLRFLHMQNKTCEEFSKIREQESAKHNLEILNLKNKYENALSSLERKFSELQDARVQSEINQIRPTDMQHLQAKVSRYVLTYFIPITHSSCK